MRRLAREEDIEVAVVVVVAPSDGTPVNVGQSRFDLGERARAVIPVDPGIAFNICVGDAREEDIEVAIVVVVTPRDGAIINAG